MITTLRDCWHRLQSLIEIRRCERETNHAQQPGSAFCRCCYRIYPCNAETMKIFLSDMQRRFVRELQ